MTVAKHDVVLQAEEDIRNVGPLKERLVGVLAKSRKKAIAIDASDVERVDAAALQLLTTFAIAVRGKERELVWHAPSEAFRKAAAETGLTEHLALS